MKITEINTFTTNHTIPQNPVQERQPAELPKDRILIKSQKNITKRIKQALEEKEYHEKRLYEYEKALQKTKDGEERVALSVRIGVTKRVIEYSDKQVAFNKEEKQYLTPDKYLSNEHKELIARHEQLMDESIALLRELRSSKHPNISITTYEPQPTKVEQRLDVEEWKYTRLKQIDRQIKTTEQDAVRCKNEIAKVKAEIRAKSPVESGYNTVQYKRAHEEIATQTNCKLNLLQEQREMHMEIMHDNWKNYDNIILALNEQMNITLILIELTFAANRIKLGQLVDLDRILNKLYPNKEAG